MRRIVATAAFLASPTFMLWLNVVLTIVFIVLVPVSLIFGWLESVAFVSVLSLWALVASHLAAALAARAERSIAASP